MAQSASEDSEATMVSNSPTPTVVEGWYLSIILLRLQYRRHVIFTLICFSHFTQFVWFLPDSRYDFTVYYKGKAVVNKLVLVTFFCGSVIQIQYYYVVIDLLAACFFSPPMCFLTYGTRGLFTFLFTFAIRTPTLLPAFHPVLLLS